MNCMIYIIKNANFNEYIKIKAKNGVLSIAKIAMWVYNNLNIHFDDIPKEEFQVSLELSRVCSAISPSPTLAIDAKAKEMRANGRDVISFCAGDPHRCA